MRRIRVVLAVATMVAVLILAASPAMARHDNDGWWDDCDWAFSPWIGWFLVCDDFDNEWRWGKPHNNWWWSPWGWWW